MINLKQILKSNNLTMKQFSELSGIPYRTLQDIERRKDCRMSTAYTIAQALHLKLDDLWQPIQNSKAGE